MRVAILSDIHGNIHALQSVLIDMESLNVSKIMFLGDLVINGPFPLECYKKIQELNPTCWVKGNTDTWYENINTGWTPSTKQEEKLFKLYEFAQKYLKDEMLEYIFNHPMKCSMEINDLSILGVHGSPRSLSEGIMKETPLKELELIASKVEESIIVSGHSHIPLLKKVDNHTFFNVGSVGMPGDGDPKACYGLIEIIDDVSKFEIRRVKYPIKDVLDLAEKRDFPEFEKYGRILKEAKLSF